MAQDLLVSADLQANERALRKELGDSVDLILRSFTTGHHGTRKGLLVFIDGLADSNAASDAMAAAVRFANPPYAHPQTDEDPILDLTESVLQAVEVKRSRKLKDAIGGILAGETALFLDGSEYVLMVDTRWHPGRPVSEPETEVEVRGPRDGFVENIRINTTLVRRRLRDPRLRVEPLQVGERTQTDICFCYIQGLVDEQVLKEARKRLKRLNLDGITSASQIEELISDNPYSPFGVLFSTERPDRVTAALLEGRVAILTDSSPFALIIPNTLWMFLKAPGDYYGGYWAGSAFRLLRFLALAVALTLPAVYTMLTTFHHEMIPTPLALTIAGGREGTPMPTVGEMLLMQVMFEVLQEAGLRLPRAVGQTVSIVGALVIGEAAVQAGIVAPGTIIVIATAGITGFAIPNYTASVAVRLLRIPLIIVTGFLGVFGFLGFTSVLILHLCSMRSFGVPFLTPIAPLHPEQLRDGPIRMPFWQMQHRPRLSRNVRTRRMAPGQRPKRPPPGGGGGP